MKIYFQNKAAKLKFSILYATCEKCPFYIGVTCPFGTGTMIDCNCKGCGLMENHQIFLKYENVL